MMNEVKTLSECEVLVAFHYKGKIKLVVVVEEDLKKVFSFIYTRLPDVLNPQKVVTEILKEFNSYLDVCNAIATLTRFPEERILHIVTGDSGKVRLFAVSECEVFYDFFPKKLDGLVEDGDL